MFLLGILDFLFVNHAYHSILTRGASVQLVFGFEYAILMTMVLTIFIKYVLHSIDLQNENPWDSKAVYMLYTELFTGTFSSSSPFFFLLIPSNFDVWGGLSHLGMAH
ncbi:E3 ubiquitin-protein ligase synoviolin-like [Egretta garzetta]|uniref:E3 ubiquitin-protein ligase synoviolin-like n=1 Tax=Egretta garzetta TaxID=188379 RepID=UPI00163B76EF|nr:E3 ubiquitin-protein ligase synoviolin-like [Egretta garzetta]